jgi:anti-sigma B factor antagonist
VAELKIKERQAGDVTILDLNGAIGFSDSPLHQAIRRLIKAGKKKIILNFEGVQHIDSGCIGEMAAAGSTLDRAGIRTGIANIRHSQDLLGMTKLMTIYDVWETVEEGVAKLGELDAHIFCPVHECHKLTPFFDSWGRGTCVYCGAEFHVKVVPSGPNKVSITSLVLRTYLSESIRIDHGTPTTITIDGRLDLFASEILEKAWLTVPPPRHVLFRVDRLVDISPPGMQKLLALCDSREGDSSAVILARSKEKRAIFPTGSPVYDQKNRAVAALGARLPRTKWTLDVQR